MKIQFKRNVPSNTFTEPSLKQGEIYVDLADKDLVVGTVDDTPSSNFHIKSNPRIADIKNDNNVNLEDVITNVEITTNTSNVSTFKFYLNNTTHFIGEPNGLTVEIKGTVESASKLTSNAGGVNTPIYFSGGKPTKITFTGGGNKLINIASGVLSNYTTKIGDANRPIYYSTQGFMPVSAISGINVLTPNLVLTNIKSKVLATDSNGIVTSAGSKGGDSTPIWIDNGEFKECSSLVAKLTYTSKSVNISSSTSNQTKLSQLGWTKSGTYTIVFSSTENSVTHYYISTIYYDINKSSGYSNGTSSADNCYLNIYYGASGGATIRCYQGSVFKAVTTQGYIFIG